MADALEAQTYQDGEVVVKQGEDGDHFYIIVEGEATVTQRKDDKSEPVVVGSLKASDYFGEVALLADNRKRVATVTAKGTLKVVKMERDRFVRLLGPVEDIMRRKMKAYKHA